MDVSLYWQEKTMLTNQPLFSENTKIINVQNTNPIYISTGAFIGRKNGRNYRLALEFATQIASDGYEFLIFDDYYENIDKIINDYRSAKLNIPVVHVEKQIGDLMGGAIEEYAKSKKLFTLNCDIAARLDSKKVVLHAWGYPASDSNPDLTCERLREYIDIAKQFSVDLLIENILCTHNDPLPFLQKIHTALPDIKFIIDTRHAQFHRELEKILDSDIMQNVRHFHINDYSGGYKEWNKLNPILQPGKGDVNWAVFFEKLKKQKYAHSITLEAPSMMEYGVDLKTLNNSLEFIRKGIK